jgi:HlyD family secretion protein
VTFGRRTLALAALLVTAAAAGVAFWAREGADPPRPAAQAAAAVAEPVGVGALGRVEPASRIRRLTQPGGFAVTRVERLLVEEGDRVEAGQTLAVFADAAQKDAAVA